MAALNTICAVTAGSSAETQSLLERMMGIQSGGELEEGAWFVDESGRFGIAASGIGSGGTFYNDPAGRLAVAFRGRITNAERLESSLRKEGHPRSAGPAELVGRLFGRFGAECAEKLHGHFNFIVWDGDAARILAFRDQTGSMPLFYSTGTDGAHAVASRVEALIGAGIAPASFDHGAIFYFLIDKALPSYETPFTGVRGLRAGERLILDGSRCLTERYYLTPIRKEPMSENEAIDRAGELLSEILVEYTGQFDEIGLMLSGGVDSMLLLSMLRSITDKPIHTFSISVGEGDGGIDHARRAAEQFKTEHTDLVIDEQFFRDNIMRLIRCYPAPAIGGWHIYLGALAAAEKGIGCILSGFGGELVFGIPPNFLKMARLHRFLRSLDPVNPSAGRLLGAMKRLASPLARLTPYAHLLGQYTAVRSGIVRWYGSRIDEKSLQALLSHDVENASRVREKYLGDYAESGTDDLIDMLTFSRMRNFEGNKVLGKSNEIAHRNGVELINPLLDRRMLEFGFSIPHELKSIGGQYRHIEASLAARYHDFRRQKSAFIAPFGEWLRSSLPSEAEFAFDPAWVGERGIFRSEELGILWNEFRRGDSGLGWADISAIISLEVWLRDVCGL